LATSLSLPLSVLRTSTSVALPAAHPTPENETEASLPPSDCIASLSRGLDRPRPGRTCRDRRRQAATWRDATTSACRTRFEQRDARVAPLSFANYSEPKFGAYLIEARHKLGRQQSGPVGGPAPASVVGIESEFGNGFGVGCRLDPLCDKLGNKTDCLLALLAITSLGRFGIIRKYRRAERGDEFDGHRK
jgi:hypothetical protein